MQFNIKIKKINEIHKQEFMLEDIPYDLYQIELYEPDTGLMYDEEIDYDINPEFENIDFGDLEELSEGDLLFHDTNNQGIIKLVNYFMSYNHNVNF